MYKMFEHEYQYCCGTTCDRIKVEAEFKELQDAIARTDMDKSRIIRELLATQTKLFEAEQRYEALARERSMSHDLMLCGMKKLTAIQEVIDNALETTSVRATDPLIKIADILDQS